jgi:hypothetical protein
MTSRVGRGELRFLACVGVAVLGAGSASVEGSAWAADVCDPVNPAPGVDPGQAKCTDAGCGDLRVSVNGADVPLALAPPGPEAHAWGRRMVVRALPDLTGKGSVGAPVRLDLRASGYDDASAYVHVNGPGSPPEGVCVVMRPRPNIRVTLDGAGAAATIYAVRLGKTVDRCQIDSVIAAPTCEMYVEPEPGANTEVALRIVGTANTELPTHVADGVVTGVTVSAPHTLFNWGTDISVGAILVGGITGGVVLGKLSDEQGGNLPLAFTAVGVTAAALVGTFFYVHFLGETRVNWTNSYRLRDGRKVTPENLDAPGFSALPARPTFTAGLAPNGLLVRW